MGLIQNDNPPFILIKLIIRLNWNYIARLNISFKTETQM